MTTSAHDLDGVRTTIQSTRADLAGTTAALAAKVDVKARVKATAATAASHVKDSTSGVTRRLVQAVTPKEGRQKAIASRPAGVESRGGRIESWRARRADGADRPRLLDRVRAWWRERKQRRARRHGVLALEEGRPDTGRPAPAGRLGDGW